MSGTLFICDGDCPKVDLNYIENYRCAILRKRFFVNQLLTWKLSILSIVFVIAIDVGMVFFAIVMLVSFHATHAARARRAAGDGGKRPLLFPFWMKDVDFGASPIYEIAFMFCNVSVCGYVNIQTQIVWVRHIATKVDIIIWCIEDLLVDVHPTTNREEKEHFALGIKQRMRHIIRQHQSMFSLMDDYAKVHKKFLMYEQKICSLVVCLTAYCTAEKLDEGELQLILILLLIATVVVHFIPCYLCTFIADKVDGLPQQFE
ncbi:putative odorant receptor OR23, partial [Operophtera brumata]